MKRDRVNTRLCLAHHRLVAGELRQGTGLVDEAKAVVQVWKGAAFRPTFVAEWDGLLSAPVAVVRREIVRTTPEAERLRGTSPFALIPRQFLSSARIRKLWLSAAGHAIRILQPSEYGQYATHLKRLDADDRRTRFWQFQPDEWIDRYVGTIHGPDTAVIGHYGPDLTLDGAIHVSLFDREGVRCAEIGVSVLPAARQHGIGYHLLERAVLWARNHRATRLYTVCLDVNRDMMLLARAHDASIRHGDNEAEAVISMDLSDATTVCLELIENQIGEWDYGTKDAARCPVLVSGEIERRRLEKLAGFGDCGALAAYLTVMRFVLAQTGVDDRAHALALAAVRANLEPKLGHRPDMRTFISGLPGRPLRDAA